MARSREAVLDELSNTRARLLELEEELAALPSASLPAAGPSLNLREYRRYGRQMILSEVGLPGASSARKEG